MNEQTVLYIQRSETEQITAEILQEISQNEQLQQESFKLEKQFTFYNAVITHSYYAIFYAAKAILAKEKIKTTAPEVHKKTFLEFEKNLIKTGKLDLELLKIYKKTIVRAQELLGIFQTEKTKRGRFTYQKLPHANKQPAQESLENAQKFFKNINKIIRT